MGYSYFTNSAYNLFFLINYLVCRSIETVAWLVYGHRLADGRFYWGVDAALHEEDLGRQANYEEGPLVCCKSWHYYGLGHLYN